jgi:hypothetical protein
LLSARPTASAGEVSALAKSFSFHAIPVNSVPANATNERQVEPSLENIRAWISAVGAAVALTDLRGLGRPADMCLVDPRNNSVTVGPVPDAGGPAYRPFRLRPTGLPYNATMAPMGCVPADINQDGSTDFIVYYWGRSPVIFLDHAKPGTPPSAADFRPRELVDPMEVWNTTALNVGDFDGSGHLGIFVGNYFPDGAHVLDRTAVDDTRTQMQDGMGDARNAGPSRMFLTTPGRPGTMPAITDVSDDLPSDATHGWTLAIGLQDLTGSGLPSIYLANDFGPDDLLINHSTPGHVAFTELAGSRTMTTPKSEVLGRDSFKGMGVTFSYPTGTGLPMMMVSDITDSYALEESNLAFVPTGTSAELAAGTVPYQEESERLGLARSGWSWDVKAGDFDNSGTDQFTQAAGFVKGTRNGWPVLQELAMGNSELLAHPQAWPKFQQGVDVSGAGDVNKFWVRGTNGRYVDLATELGLGQSGVSRGFALGDVNGDDRLDMIVANQWANSTLLVNTGTNGPPGADLHLVVPGVAGGTTSAIGAQVTTPASDGVPAQKSQLYPANGHAGVSAADLHLALPRSGAPLTATVTWLDTAGPHHATITATAGHHTVLLTPDGKAEQQ